MTVITILLFVMCMALGTELYLAQKTIKLLREKIFRFSERMELIEELERLEQDIKAHKS